jgi:hypothetical protein
MEHLPAVGSPLEVMFGNGRSLHLIVLRPEEGAVAVRAPVNDPSADPSSPDLHAFSHAHAVAVGWRAGTSWYVAPVREVVVSDAGARWQVVFDDEPRVTNRRRFVRGGGGESIELSDIGPGGAHVFVAGSVSDLSEGGARCRVTTFRRTSGDSTVVRLTLGDRTIEIPSSVYLVQGVEVIVVFRKLSERDAQTIRQHLFQRELAERRAGLR